MADLKFTFRRPCLELSGEVGSIAELIGYMQTESSALTLAFGDDMEMVVQRIGGATGEPPKGETAEAPATTAEPPRRRGHPPAANKEAVAPDPLPVPSSEAPLAPTASTPLPPNALNTAPNANGVPAFLDASNRAPPPVPPATSNTPPPLPAAPPPVGVLGPKVAEALQARAANAADGGQALADWLASHGLTIAGKTFPEACRAVLMISDEKLKVAAEQLGVS